jgi:Protein of unknown function (DUF3421)/Zinc finger, C3HC4 type (RING finger)
MEAPKSCNSDIWQAIQLRDRIPNDAVRAGQDSEGRPLYVGRIWHRDDLVPGIIVGTSANPVHVHKITAPWGCVENVTDRGTILTGTGYSWLACANGKVPEEAVFAGVTANREILYAGRAVLMGQTIPGKIHPSHNVLYIGWNGKEHNFREYEVLVHVKPTTSTVPVAGETSGNGKCCVCLENEATMAVMPCGHFCLCAQCNQNPSLRRCPVCRGPKRDCVRIFKI